MITVHQLAEIISRSKHGTKLKQISRQPGKELYEGLCPFHHEKTPSFQVYVGSDGAGHYHCKGCLKNGNAEWWLRNIEGQRNLPVSKPNPEEVKQRQAERARERALKEVRDAYPDLPSEAEAFITTDDSLSMLRWRLSRKLSSLVRS